MTERILEPGQIWVGDCLSSYEPELWFVYVLLSADEEDGIKWWSAADFMKGVFGAQVRKFTEDEIRKLNYSGHITGSWFRNMIKRILYG